MQRPIDSSGSGHARRLVADLPLSMAMPLSQDRRGDATISSGMFQRILWYISQFIGNVVSRVIKSVALDADEDNSAAVIGGCAQRPRCADEADHPPMTDAVSCTPAGLAASSALSSISVAGS